MNIAERLQREAEKKRLQQEEQLKVGNKAIKEKYETEYQENKNKLSQEIKQDIKLISQQYPSFQKFALYKIYKQFDYNREIANEFISIQIQNQNQQDNDDDDWIEITSKRKILIYKMSKTSDDNQKPKRSQSVTNRHDPENNSQRQSYVNENQRTQRRNISGDRKRELSPRKFNYQNRKYEKFDNDRNNIKYDGRRKQQFNQKPKISQQNTFQPKYIYVPKHEDDECPYIPKSVLAQTQNVIHQKQQNLNENTKETINQQSNADLSKQVKVTQQLQSKQDFVVQDKITQDQIKKQEEQNKQDQTQKEQQRQDKIRQEQQKQEQIKQEQIKQEQQKQEQQRLEQIKQEQIKQEKVRQEQIRLEQIRLEQIKQEQIKQELIKQEQIKQQAKNEQARQEMVRLEEIKKEQIRLEQIKQEQLVLEQQQNLLIQSQQFNYQNQSLQQDQSSSQPLNQQFKSTMFAPQFQMVHQQENSNINNQPSVYEMLMSYINYE